MKTKKKLFFIIEATQLGTAYGDKILIVFRGEDEVVTFGKDLILVSVLR